MSLSNSRPRSFFRTDSTTLPFVWLMKVRLVMLLLQTFLVGMIHSWLDVTLSLPKLSIILGIGYGSQLLAMFIPRSFPNWQHNGIRFFIMLDILLLTSVLFYTGGANNPFSFLYLIYVVLGIVMLNAWWIWGVCILTLGCYGLLFLQEADHHHMIHSKAQMDLHLNGMWVAYTVTALFIGYFVTQMKQAMHTQEQELEKLQDLHVRSDKIAALGALAGKAIHDFSSPLATIAVVAKDLEKQLNQHNTLEHAAEDARLIRIEVDNCKQILEELMLHAGETLGEASIPVQIDQLFSDTLRKCRYKEAVKLDIAENCRKQDFHLPPKAFVQALSAILQNSVDASLDLREDPPIQPDSIVMRASIQGKELHVAVSDKGKGIPKHLQEHIGEPFFTTKKEEQGHGLGLFLAQTLIEQLGGALRIQSEEGQGSQVSFIFPLEYVMSAEA